MNRALALLPLAAGAMLAAATPLPRMKVLIDGRAADVGKVTLELTTYRLELAATLRQLYGGHATVRMEGAKSCLIDVDGQPRARLNVGDDASAMASIVTGGAFRKVELSEPALMEKIDGAPKLVLDVRALCELTGVTADLDGRTMNLTTPEWWADRLGIDRDRYAGLNLRSVGYCTDFGITPPAQNMVVWVRPSTQSFVQIYKDLASGVPSPMLGYARGKPVQVEDGVTPPGMWSAAPDATAQAFTSHLEEPGSGVAMYAAIVSKSELTGEDAVADINDGGVDDWVVVGLRQSVAPSSLTFRYEVLQRGETIGKLAGRVKMPADLLMSLNGYGEKSKPAAGTKLLVFDKLVPVDSPSDKAVARGLYEVRVGDTTESLAKSWGVSEEVLAQFNDFELGEDLEPGEVITRVAAVAAPAVPSGGDGPPLAPVQQLAKMLQGADARVASDPASRATGRRILKGTVVAIEVKDPARGVCRVRDGDTVGWIALSCVSPLSGGDAPPPSGPVENRVRQQALAYIGTPYVWGGNNLSRGIDCSHFVAQVLTRSGVNAPSAPVFNQEANGVMVHHVKGLAYYRGRTVSFPDTQPLTNLRVGDRIIMQRNVQARVVGSRHTGVYIGRYQGPWGSFQHAVVHASCSKGVTVSELTRGWLAKNYRFAMRDVPGGKRR